MALGIRGFNPIWTEFDLTGHLFDDTFYLFVLENTIPYVPANVYHTPDISPGTEWSQPIQFLANGTLPVDIYFEPDTVYRLEFRQGDTQNDPLIYEVNDYVPGSGGSTPVDTVATTSSNQITNPQFAIINFTSPVSISATNPDPIEVAPGWFLELAGTGTVTITQVPLNSANTNPSNAPYALELNMTGWTADSVFLRQRFEQNGMLWANKYVSSTLTARVQGASVIVNASLYDSMSVELINVLYNKEITGDYTEYTGNGQLPATSNTDTPPSAYIDYKLALPSNVDIYLTSIQLVVQDLPVEPEFEQDSIDRQIDHTFHYYKPQLEYKPVPSYLVGWDFPLNPSQFFADGVYTLTCGANKSEYVWDQTIIFETGNNFVSTSRDTASNGLKIAVSSNSSFAIIQYIPKFVAREILSQRIALQLKAKVSATTLAGTVSLWWTADASLPDIKTPTFKSLVSSITDGIPSTSGNGTWNQVLSSIPSHPSAPFTLTTTSQEFDFSGFEDTSTGETDATFMAVVVCFNTMSTTQTMTLEYCSLMGGDIATRPAPQTPDQVRRECQYYYRKSFLANTTPAQNVGINTGESYAIQAKTSLTADSIGPVVRFDYPMINTPSVLLYNPAVGGVSGQIRNEEVALDFTSSGVGSSVSVNGFYAIGTTANLTSVGQYIGVHWTADARLGTY